MRVRVRTEPCSPRLLVLKIDGRSINLTVIVAHAPPNDSGEQGRKSFWSSLRKAAKAVPRARPLALLIDTNGRVGIPKSRFIGSCPADVENANGSELRRVLEERNLHAVSTFTPVYQPTWWSGRAQHRGRRVDYVAVSSDWTDDAAKPTTLPAIQLPGESVDQVPVRASMLWPQFSSGDQKSLSRKHDSLALDPWLINCPDARSWFQHYTSACFLPGTAWVGGRRVQRCAQRVASVRNILFWCPEIGSKAEKTLDESNNCCYECVDRPRQTPAAQI